MGTWMGSIGMILVNKGRRVSTEELEADVASTKGGFGSF